MATRQEIAEMLGKIKAARAQLEDAEYAVTEAHEVLRDAYALIDAMSDELAELRESA